MDFEALITDAPVNPVKALYDRLQNIGLPKGSRFVWYTSARDGELGGRSTKEFRLTVPSVHPSVSEAFVLDTYGECSIFWKCGYVCDFLFWRDSMPDSVEEIASFVEELFDDKYYVYVVSSSVAFVGGGICKEIDEYSQTVIPQDGRLEIYSWSGKFDQTITAGGRDKL